MKSAGDIQTPFYSTLLIIDVSTLKLLQFKSPAEVNFF